MSRSPDEGGTPTGWAGALCAPLTELALVISGAPRVLCALGALWLGALWGVGEDDGEGLAG